MKLISKMKMGGLVGSLYLLNNGYYSYKIKLNGLIVARSYTYINGKERASDMLKTDMEIISNQQALF